MCIRDRLVTDDEESGHRVVMTETIVNSDQTHHEPKHNSWNFRKANWKLFRTTVDLDVSKIEGESNTEIQLKQLCKLLHSAVKRSIPRGRMNKNKPFWNGELQKLRMYRNNQRNKAEKTKRPQDIQEWQRVNIEYINKLQQAKKRTFNKFISNLNYREDAVKVHKYINTLSGKHNRKPTDPIKTVTKALTSD